MSLYRQLQARQVAENPIRVGVIGAGKFGTMFLAQALNLPGIHVIGIADLNVDRAKSNLALAHWPTERYSARSLDDANRSGATHIGDNALALIEHPTVDVIIEAI